MCPMQLSGCHMVLALHKPTLTIDCLESGCDIQSGIHSELRLVEMQRIKHYRAAEMQR